MLKIARNIISWFKGKKPILIIIIGLDNAGKSTLLNTYKGTLDEDVLPNVGLGGVYDTKIPKYNVKILDLGGFHGFRDAWLSYLGEVHGVVFVVDSGDKKRINEASKCFDSVTSDTNINGKPILVYANKQDIASALDIPEISRSLKLDLLTQSSHNVIKCIAKSSCNNNIADERIMEGFRWLLDNIDRNYDSINLKVEEFNKNRKKESSPSPSPVTPLPGPQLICSKCKSTPANKNGEITNFQPLCDSCFDKRNLDNALIVEDITTPPLNPVPVITSSDEPEIPPSQVQPKKTKFECVNGCGREATHKSSKSGWRPICDECDK